MVSSLSLDVGYFLGRFQHFFVDRCSAVSCDFGVFVKKKKKKKVWSCPSAPPSGKSFPKCAS